MTIGDTAVAYAQRSPTSAVGHAGNIIPRRPPHARAASRRFRRRREEPDRRRGSAIGVVPVHFGHSVDARGRVRMDFRFRSTLPWCSRELEAP
jgi:hypothetical protein